MSYKDFIQNILDTRGRFACGEEYHERHHIKPKCVGGTNEKNNLIDLYAKEHFEAHRLLALENQNVFGLTHAWWCMSHVQNEYEERYEVTPEEYEEAKKYMSLAMSGENNACFNRKHTFEECQKMKENHKDFSGQNHPRFGKKLSEESKDKIRQKAIGRESSLKGKKRENFSDGNHPRAVKIVCENHIYDCIKDCAKKYKTSPANLTTYLKGNKPMPYIWKQRGLRYFKKEGELL